MNLRGKSNEELLALASEIENDPANQISGSIWKYTPEARRKLDKIRRAITQNLREAKLARGEKINDAGYSGRKTNKRR